MLIHGQGCGLNMIKQSLSHLWRVSAMPPPTNWNSFTKPQSFPKAGRIRICPTNEKRHRGPVSWKPLKPPSDTQPDWGKTWNNWRTSGSEKGVFWESHVDEVMMKHYHTVGILWTAHCPRPIAFSTDVGARVPLVPSSFVKDSLICKTLRNELFLQFKFHYC